jgi:hypothetical protein
MLASLAADAVLVLHLAFIVFAALGAALVAWRVRFAWLHLPALAWGIWIELSHGICPLTPLENSLRRAAGAVGYEGSFIEHYLVPLIYPPGLNATQQLWIAGALVVVNAFGYGVLLYGWGSGSGRKSD